MRLRSTLAASATIALLLGACAQGEREQAVPASPPDETTPSSEATSSSEEGITPFTFGSGTDQQAAAGAGPMIVVTDVRMGSHDGFDRLVFDIGGDGEAGWDLAYTDDPRTQGKGEKVEVAGDAVLAASIRNVAMPTDEESVPEGVEPWDGPERLEGPEGGHIVEVVDDTVFEGRHLFHVGLEGEVPFTVQRLEDPQRVVIDFLLDEE
ncbi:hypothetical protein H0B56_02250 [Haloechinothrix sp. YIM 98757]|uniref:AMIN-like domain-containing protein n=1 Tax=Haloechinothrix aidingensis TaxID=2752311 RepID=A0A838A5Q9_9PSEU|nr:hypothetical protein [Haloechinothrix aidingensis]MBA0124358.1 hypothetical protein [Haloechinothrix aidingensis]